jgi:hypothetical protein
MASNIKWYKRALRALDSGRLDIWEKIKNKLPEERRNYLEDTFKLNTPTETPIEPITKNILEEEVAVKLASTKAIKPKSTKKRSTSKKTPSTRKKKTTSKEK